MLKIDHFNNSNGQDFDYLVYLPDSSSNKLIINLHGAGERDNIDKVKMMGINSYASNNNVEAIIVSPICPKDKYWGCYIESLNTFIDMIIDKYDIDKNHVSLTGYSMGGTGVYMWAMANPERFKAILPVCGSGIYWYAEQLVNMKVYIVHGKDDDIVPVEESINMDKAIRNRGGKPILKLLDNVGHNAWDYAYDRTTINYLLD